MKDRVSRHSLPFNHHTADTDAVAEDIGVVEDEVAPTQMSDSHQIVLSDYAAVDMFAFRVMMITLGNTSRALANQTSKHKGRATRDQSI